MILDLADLPATVASHELVGVMVAGANARAARVAPCLLEPDKGAARAEAKLILAGAVQRWTEAGAGAMQSASAGPFGMQVDTRQRTGFNLWPSEIEVLQSLCAADSTGAFGVDTAPGWHTPTTHPFTSGG